MAYKKQDILNYTMQETANELYEKQLIDKSVYESIFSKFIHDLYSPKLFIRFVAGIITIIGCLFAGGFLGMLSNFSNIRLLIFLNGVFSVIALEVGINNKKIYNAGIDNVFQLIAVGCFTDFITADFLSPGNNYITYLIIMILSIVCSYRYIDALMAFLANLSKVICLVLICFELGNMGKIIAPFIVFIFSVSEYFIIKKLLAGNKIFIYKKVLKSLSTLSLLLIYCSLNYYVICELNNMINNTNVTTIPLGFLFWISTFFIPILYIGRSIQLKNKGLLLTGICCLIASFASFRYYHSLLPTEWALFIVGLILILFGYWLIKFLHANKNGFTSRNIYGQINKNDIFEAMIAAQVAASSTSNIDKAQNGTQFGGGSSGGGGASDSY